MSTQLLDEGEKDIERPPSRLSGGFLSASEPALSDISSRPVPKASSFTVERTDEEEVQIEEKIPVLNTILKWIFSIFLFSAMLFCLVASKIALVLLGIYYNNFLQTEKLSANNDTSSTSPGNQKTYKYSKESIFILLAMVMMIPQLFSFLVTAFKVVTKKKALPGPTTIAAVWVSQYSSCHNSLYKFLQMFLKI